MLSDFDQLFIRFQSVRAGLSSSRFSTESVRLLKKASLRACQLGNSSTVSSSSLHEARPNTAKSATARK